MDLNLETRHKLFSIIRAGMGLSEPVIELTSEETTDLLHLARRQSILPLFYRGALKMRIPVSSLKSWDQYRIKNEYQEIQHEDALKRIRGVFDEEGIPYILLKGAVIRCLYPDITLRSNSDMDILVHETDIERAVHLLEEKTDFKTNKRHYHDISMISTRVHLELHFSIKEYDEQLDPILVKAWEYAKPSGEGSMHVFSPEYQIFHVVAHMRHHFLRGGLGIRPFLDLWLLRNKTQYNEDQVQSLVSKCGILQFYTECCYLSDVWMGSKEHTDTSSLFESFCLSGGVFGNEQFRTAGAQRHKRGWRYLCNSIFPPKYQVKERYKDLSGKEHILPYYYVKRWKCWLSKERRDNLNQQIKASMTSDKKYQDAADDLFRKLGL